jgi:hypothetical protein
LQLTTFVGMTGRFSPVAVSLRVQVDLPVGATVRAVAARSPDRESFDPVALPYAVDGSQVSFAVEIEQYSLVTISV